MDDKNDNVFSKYNNFVDACKSCKLDILKDTWDCCQDEIKSHDNDELMKMKHELFLYIIKQTYNIRKNEFNKMFETIKFLNEHDFININKLNTYIKKVIMYNTEGFFCNIDNNSMQIFKYLLTIAKKHNINTKKYIKHVIYSTFSFKNLQTCKELITDLLEYLENDDGKIDLTTFFEYCCQEGEIDLVKYFYNLTTNDKYIIDLHCGNDRLFNAACRSGEIDIVDYLLNVSKDKNGNSTIKISDYHFGSACINGNLDIVKYLLKLPKDNNNTIKINNHHFLASCLSGNLKLVKYLLKNAKDVIDIRYNNDTPFCYACSSGNLELVKYLLKLSKDNNGKYTININVENNTPFINACKSGNLELVKYLLEISKDENGNYTINIENNNHKAFKKVCKYRNIEIVEFLCSINPNYSYIINEDNEIEYKIIDDLYDNNKYIQMLEKLNIIKEIEIADSCNIDCLICHMSNNDLDNESKNTLVKLSCNNSVNHCTHVMCLYSWYVRHSNKKCCVLCDKEFKIDECEKITNSI